MSKEAERRLRRDLRGLLALESVQRALAIGALVVIAVRSVVLASDRATAVSIAAAVLLALTCLALAFRIRMGQELLRRDLRAIELRDELEVERRAHPYRSSPADPLRRDVSR